MNDILPYPWQTDNLPPDFRKSNGCRNCKYGTKRRVSGITCTRYDLIVRSSNICNDYIKRGD